MKDQQERHRRETDYVNRLDNLVAKYHISESDITVDMSAAEFDQLVKSNRDGFNTELEELDSEFSDLFNQGG